MGKRHTFPAISPAWLSGPGGPERAGMGITMLRSHTRPPPCCHQLEPGWCVRLRLTPRGTAGKPLLVASLRSRIS
jgi:hypothetical protein